jgi:glycerophosphoryl diester phosphodiesterase
MPNRSNTMGFFAGRHPRVMAHRGASGEAPENTIPAFALAVEQDADILEMDVHLTSDGVVVVCHDPTVDRTTDGSGAIASMTFAELQQLDAGYRFTADGGKTFPYRGKGIRIPTLEEVLCTFPGMPVNIEVKAHSRKLVEATVALLAHYGRFADRSAMLAAFNDDLMKLIRAAVPDGAYTSFSVTETRRFMMCAWLRVFGFRSPGLAFQVPVRKSVLRIVTPRFVRTAKRFGFEVHPWTIDDEREMHRLLDMGVDGLFTNYPARARKVLATRAAR